MLQLQICSLHWFLLNFSRGSAANFFRIQQKQLIDYMSMSMSIYMYQSKYDLLIDVI